MTSYQTIQFVTGRLAEPALREVVTAIQAKLGFRFSIEVLPITVAALMTPAWIARHLKPDLAADLILLPGYCQGDLTPVRQLTNTPVQCGPRDLWELPEFFGQTVDRSGYGEYRIEILAEINHAPQMPLEQLLAEARQLSDAGADLIDVGCSPGVSWTQAGDAIRALRDAGHRVSIDSFDPDEVAQGVAAGAELVLSVNSSNREAAVDWGCEVVAIPDDPGVLDSLFATADFLSERNVPFRFDPVLEPIGCGFTPSLQRYCRVRERFPAARMLMGIGNITELTDVDSAGINVVLLGFCEELGIQSVLTTQVIPWARTSVRECDLARRLVHFAVQHGVIPKHLEPRLVVLRDVRRHQQSLEYLDDLSQRIRDRNYRIFAEHNEIHLVSRQMHLHAEDPFALFSQLMATHPTNVDAEHAFYLGYEMAKAKTALTIGKQYRQDQALDWGFLTQDE